MDEEIVAATIRQHLGGSFERMTGAKNFLYGTNSKQETYLIFALPAKSGFTKNGINRVRITLNASDTYTMQFFRVREFKITEIKEINDVYCDQLRELFTENTGLATVMPRVFFK